jgi:hypothetical protein
VFDYIQMYTATPTARQSPMCGCAQDRSQRASRVSPDRPPANGSRGADLDGIRANPLLERVGAGPVFALAVASARWGVRLADHWPGMAPCPRPGTF